VFVEELGPVVADVVDGGGDGPGLQVVVERSHAWVMHARDYERLIQHSESLITWAAITLMTRRITRRSGQPTSREAQRG
jgi:hypothetical protein